MVITTEVHVFSMCMNRFSADGMPRLYPSLSSFFRSLFYPVYLRISPHGHSTPEFLFLNKENFSPRQSEDSLV